MNKRDIYFCPKCNGQLKSLYYVESKDYKSKTTCINERYCTICKKIFLPKLIIEYKEVGVEE